MTLTKIQHRPVVKTWNGLFNELFGEMEQAFNPAHTQPVPAVNIIETAEGYHAEVIAPGRKKENFSLKVENQLLVISYQADETATPENWKRVRTEYKAGNFKRTFSVDDSIQTDGIQAKYEDGILKLFLPKKPELKPAVVDIQVQ
ncbi:MAG: Hsp20/alpha crystallin family protein [Chitinophagaceae bacterium]|jgi:HSP20 family protein|nr:Hsp20/alpha crystallin family protein [Chitinophagaceae bacterium]